ncbi:MAG TPA: cupin domain-containing protein [Candidatus Dormibacteraeota bacterium]|nr:cupin domain-containing protein [Candidatus Dormibacteraeota bacterium]
MPIHEGFGLDLLRVEASPWPRLGCSGALILLEGRGDFVDCQLLELAPGGQCDPQRHLYEEVVYVLEGRGSTTVEGPARKDSFEWGTGSLFALPPNVSYRHFNTSGQQRARLASVTSLPLLLKAFHDHDFVFANDFDFPERFGSERSYRGEGEFIPVRAGRHQWETNFVPDLRQFELQAWESRGVGSSNIKFVLADGTMHAHMSELAVGTYKKAHRHGPDFHIFPVTGRGYSLFWREGDADHTRIDWRHGWVYAPPDQVFHQHFNTDAAPSRYVAVAYGSIRYPFTSDKRELFGGGDRSVNVGGRQIEYEDEDPRIGQTFRQELALNEIRADPRMEEIWTNRAPRAT